MNHSVRHIALLLLAVGLVIMSGQTLNAEELYNLEILFKKTYNDLEPDSIVIFGEAICGAGDVNGDGYDDIAAAGWEYNPPLGWRCMTFVFLGGSPMDTIPDFILKDTYWGGSPWARLAGGDVNGDSFSDIVVGLPYGPGNIDIYFGGNPMDTIVDLVLWEPPTGSDFASDVSTGDVNGDGYCDVVASDYYKDSGKGAAYVFYGGPLLDNLPDITLRGHGAEGFGMTVGSGGDVNSDGYDEIVVGAWVNSEKYFEGGRVYVYYGGDPMDTTYDAAMYGEGVGQHLGWDGVSIAENTYTHDFVIAGTQFWPRGFPFWSPGKVYVLFGGDPMDSIPDVWMHGQTDTSSLGPTSGAGDIDGDGVHDVIAGAHAESGRLGAVYVWLAGIGMDTIPDAWIKGDSAFAEPGWRVASAGDVDGDGKDEVMLSNYAASTPRHTVWVCKYTGTGIDEEHVLKSPVQPSQRISCIPNPFRHSTTIRISPQRYTEGTQDPDVLLAIHDATGRLIRRLEIENNSSAVTWDGKDMNGKDVGSGVYFAKVNSAHQVPPEKLLLIR
ncbi:hypothetical protein E3J62_06960 [candidate division TA06 bacterium]|uniref:FlgD/Vpr Ig-like domain-containing protein n=1 Tax=candidate division TA06 bacterium TaxID=2250710 RepID=A0A523USV9_UNCT6|nr:MAG: hypothetical protein E3J62_06960 [candidate division TA06 bacterium]